MARIYISVGSNIDREKNISKGVIALKTYFDNVIKSSVYESKALGFNGDDFYNLVVAADTDQDALTVRNNLQKIEEQQGRLRTQARFTSRTLDLDLLLYDAEIIKQDGFEIPRGEITEYAFVLKPLCEIAPNERHPVISETYKTLWERFEKKSQPLTKIEYQWEE
ncbi:MAG: 2-amino-4-hydroxy-6-hydroxymethyldihydropteridine diphosphokinase [Gammaproteobacteria bacterium]|nr:2-amino-4-hydroxy-6-hydroxymethyldihydropteridine diphosphokinase [Gammaproteobacteria bacterium]